MGMTRSKIIPVASNPKHENNVSFFKLYTLTHTATELHTWPPYLSKVDEYPNLKSSKCRRTMLQPICSKNVK